MEHKEILKNTIQNITQSGSRKLVAFDVNRDSFFSSSDVMSRDIKTSTSGGQELFPTSVHSLSMPCHNVFFLRGMYC